MADISKINLSGAVYNIKDATARANLNEIQNISNAEIDEITDLVLESLPSSYVYGYETAAAMQADLDLQEGMIAHTNGFTTSGDGDAAYYTISNSGTADGSTILALQNGLRAIKVSERNLIDAIPNMSATTRGIAKVGAGLSMNGDALELDGNGDIATAVTSWLNAHPEATTTVQDNSVTDAKLVQTGGVLSNLVKYTGVSAISGWINDYIINTSVAVGATVSLTPVSKRYCQYVILECSAGDTFTINGGSNGTGGNLVAFVDSNNVMLSLYSGERVDFPVQAPSNTAKVIINRWTVGNNCYKGWFVPQVAAQIAASKEDAIHYAGVLSDFDSSGDAFYAVGPSTANVPDMARGYGWLLSDTVDGYKNAILFRERYKTPALYMYNRWYLPFSDEKFALIGDSITEVNWTASVNWTKLLEADGAEVVNLGIGGTGFSRTTGGQENNYINRISSIPSDATVIGVSGSWNDMSAGKAVGTPDDTTSSTIAGDMNTFFDALLDAFPDKPIVCYTTNPWDVYRYGVERSDQYIEVLDEICKRKGIPFHSLYTETCIRPWNASNKAQYMVDGSHPNNLGHTVIYNHLRGFFEENLNSHI